MTLNTRLAIMVALLAASPTIASAGEPAGHPCPPASDTVLDAQSAKLIGIIDSNQDGKMTTAEFLAHVPDRTATLVRMERWKQAVTNDDGKLSLSEMQARYRFIARRSCTSGAAR